MARKKPDRETLQKIYEEENQGVTAVARRFEVSANTVYCWLDSLGIREKAARPGTRVCVDCGGRTTHSQSPRCRACFKATRPRKKPPLPPPGTPCANPDCFNTLSGQKTKVCSRKCNTILNNRARKGMPTSPREGSPRAVVRSESGQRLDDYLRDHYARLGPAKIAKILGIKTHQVVNRAQCLGLKMDLDAYRETVHGAAAKHMRDHNPMRTDAARKRMSKWMRSAQGRRIFAKMQEGHARLERGKPSGLEKKLRSILDSLGVEYVPSFVVKANFVVDIKIGDLILQADGEWWHGHPRFEPLNDRQIAQRKRDASHDKYLRKCGYTVVRIWERDVTPEHVKTIVENHCARTGRLFA